LAIEACSGPVGVVSLDSFVRPPQGRTDLLGVIALLTKERGEGVTKQVRPAVPSLARDPLFFIAELNRFAHQVPPNRVPSQ
jgi:hypothetical protein